jgi:hypothetical protein
MADNKDLDSGDDLDLEDVAGEDFAGELDDVMNDDELGDDMDVGETELDSFFEDLSSIEDVNSSSDSAASAGKPDVAAAPLTTGLSMKPRKSASNKSGKLALTTILFLLLSAAGAYWYMFMQNDDMFPAEIEPPQEMMAFDNTLSLEDQESIIPKMQPLRLPTPVRRATKASARGRYLLQVAVCPFNTCRSYYLRKIRQLGEPVFQKKSGKGYDFIELISSQVYGYPEANDLAQVLNLKNKRAGNAYVVSQANGYRVTMGTFTALSRAKAAKFYLEKFFSRKELVFNLEHVKRSYSATKIYAGPYNSRAEARKILKRMKKRGLFEDAYLVKY